MNKIETLTARVIVWLTASLGLAFMAESFAAPISVSVATSQPGTRISENALGLSYETSMLAPNAVGVRYFRSDNQPLLKLFATLGVKSLRIGGNSVDDPKVPVPRAEDVRAFFDFARAAGVKVIYSVRLQDGDPSSAASYAKIIHDTYPDVLECFAIGNEPSYYKDYAVYLPKWTAIRDAILAVYPDAKFCGPDQNPDPVLTKKMVHDLGDAAGHLVQITQHSYPFGCAYKNPAEGQKDVAALVPFDAAASRQKMLSPAAYEIYRKIQRGMADAVAGTPLSYRLTETNSYWFSGLQGASDRYASALWAVDYLHWWVAQGAEGLNFHTGDRTGGSVNLPCRYAAFVTAGQGYEARPLAYGMKLFSLGGHGRSLPVTVTSAAEQNLAAYAVLAEDRTVAVTLINKVSRADALDAEVQIKLSQAPTSESHVKIISLTAKHNDIAAGSADVSLGGAPIAEAGDWKGQWSELPAAAINGDTVTVTLPPASAGVLKLQLR